MMDGPLTLRSLELQVFVNDGSERLRLRGLLGGVPLEESLGQGVAAGREYVAFTPVPGPGSLLSLLVGLLITAGFARIRRQRT